MIPPQHFCRCRSRRLWASRSSPLTCTADCRTVGQRRGDGLMSAAIPRQERLEARVTAEQKELLQRAAALEGRTLTDFVVRSIQRAAEQTIRRHQELVLKASESQAFVDALLNPPAPNHALRHP